MHSQTFLLNLKLCLFLALKADALAWPEPTPEGLAFNARQWSPRPTGRVLSPLEKRQESGNNYRTCGYLDGLPG